MGARTACALAAAAWLAACTSFVLEPDVPAVEPPGPVTRPSAELVVTVEPGDYSDPRSLSGFAVVVDGKVRAWLPGLTGRASVQVPAGEHVVRVAHPWREVGLLLVVPIPEQGELAVETRVRCAEGAPCAVAVRPTIDPAHGLRLRVYEPDPAETAR
jgi:hypothetical protein